MVISQCRKRQLILIGTIILFTTFLINNAYSQIKDNINWSSIKVITPIDEEISFSITPIIRFNNDLSSYQNTSIDLAIKKNISEKWHMQLLSRTWFIPDEAGRQFIWFDVGYNFPLRNFKIASHTRLHLALDINDRNDPDYLRWKTTFSLPSVGRVVPFVAIEPWLRINDDLQLQRMRYEPGCHLSLKQDIKLSLTYRREDSVNLIPTKRFNMYLITLTFNS
ncbi:MAG: DUF2490 domain-containing protein [Saprospiraceae bacterium]|nr:DUF2490 domain-containing protein [Saprospiraceae bacterium]